MATHHFRPRSASNVVPGDRSSAVSHVAFADELEDGSPPAAAVEDGAGWMITRSKDDARDKAVSSHETMGLVSALLAGFELQALTEVSICNDFDEDGDKDCTGFESAFIISASYCVGLSTLVVLETSFEYMFVMRELHHGRESAWNLIAAFTPFRRAAEIFFTLEILCFLLSTGFMLQVRFANMLPGGVAISQFLLITNFLLIFAIVALMQRAKLMHGRGKQLKREEALERRERRRQEVAQRKALSANPTQRSTKCIGGKRLSLTGAAVAAGSMKNLLAGMGGPRRPSCSRGPCQTAPEAMGGQRADAFRASADSLGSAGSCGGGGGGGGVMLSPVASVNMRDSPSTKEDTPSRDAGESSSWQPPAAEGLDDPLADATDHTQFLSSSPSHRSERL